MKVGIISDTHDDITNVRRAIKIFNENVSYVIHAGDYVFPGIINEFSKLNKDIEFIGVLGNNDGERIGIYECFKNLKFDFYGEFAEVEIDGVKFGIYHGTNVYLKKSLIESERYDVFICGHTHKKENSLNKKTLVLNPGSAHSQMQDLDEIKKPMLILYDTNKRSFSFLEIK